MESIIDGIEAIQWAKEISKIPDGVFTVAFFSYSSQRRMSSDKLTVKEGCKMRAQMPNEKIEIDSDNLFLFTDGKGQPRMCYRYLIRFMAFPNGGFKMHKINWL